MPTIAIVGAGPQLGLAIARTFGSQGHAVALIARNKARLGSLVAQLTSEGIPAEAFAADVLDRSALTGALEAASARFGGIDVLEYSPSGTVNETVFTLPSQTAPEHLQQQLEFQLYGAIAATAAVLPRMRRSGTGTLLFTTGAGSIDPVPFVANVNAAAAALRNWTINLNQELSQSGVYAAHVAIDASIDQALIPEGAAPVASAEAIAATYWDLHLKRQDSEYVFHG